MFGINDMFNYYNAKNLENNNKNDCLAISLGHSSTHVIPILNNEV